MARPTTKVQLLEAADENFNKLFSLIHSMSKTEQEQTFVFEDRDRNIRDILVHLYEWHNLLLRWIASNRTGEKSNFLPEPYNWKTYPQMNIKFWEKHQNTPYDEAIRLLHNSHAEVMHAIDAFSNDELFMNKYFDWTGSTSVGSYCVSATSSHYDWAMKKIKKHKKILAEK